MTSKHKLDKILVGIALLLGACGQSQVPTTTQSPTPKAEKTAITQVTPNKSSETNIGIQRVTLASLDAKSDRSANRGAALSEVDPLELKGTITIAGSPVVFPISNAIAERFKQEGYPDPINVASVETPTSFALFCQQGKTDIVNSARLITESEAQACAKSGRKPIVFTVAMDAVTIVVSTQNEFLPKTVTKEQLKQLVTAEQWSNINPDWPDQPIQRMIRPPSTEIVRLFVNTVLDGKADLLLKAPNTRVFQDPDQVTAEASTNPDLISFMEHAYYANNKNSLRALAIDGVAPSGEKNYPLARPLYIYADANAIQKRPELKAFISYYLAHVNEEIVKIGYFPASPAVLEESKAKLKNPA
ncbi:MAG TPA: substrate-binding domain-containing protein [Waterburya sp.]|jgi:phosphate transport system substrate-binding protein